MNDAKAPWKYWVEKAFAIFKEEAGQIRPRQHVFSLASRAIPARIGNELRATLFRLRGIDVGPGTVLYDTPELSGGEARDFSNLSIGCNCTIDIGCMFELGDKIAIGDNVMLGYQVLIITSTHELGTREQRAGQLVRNPVKIDNGAWIGSRCVILPGVTVGEGAIVEPCSVVNREVAPHTRVRGIPARRVEA